MSAAETLREAAALMRERAQAATDGPWRPRDWTDYGEEPRPVVAGGHGNYIVAEAARYDRAHIAGMDPLVALAVADWLDDQARYWDTVDADPSYGYMEGDPALAVARAYLGDPLDGAA